MGLQDVHKEECLFYTRWTMGRRISIYDKLRGRGRELCGTPRFTHIKLEVLWPD